MRKGRFDTSENECNLLEHVFFTAPWYEMAFGGGG